MSVKKWRQLAEEKMVLDKQTEEIHQKFRTNKINKEFGQLSGEELFKPITKRLDEKSSENVEEEKEEEKEEEEEEEEEEVPDESRSDASPPAYQEFAVPGSSEDETKKLTSNRLRTGRSLISKFGNIPNYRVKSKESYFCGKNIEEIKAELFNLETIQAHQQHTEKLLKRTQLQETKATLKPPEKQEAEKLLERTQLQETKATLKPPETQEAETLLERTQFSSKQLQEQKKKLKTPKKQQKRRFPIPPWERAVESRRPYFAYSNDEQDFSDYEQDWETEGSGLSDEAEKLINQLHLSLGSIKAGNSSIKLKNQVLYVLHSLVELGTIDKKEKKKLLLII